MPSKITAVTLAALVLSLCSCSHAGTGPRPLTFAPPPPPPSGQPPVSAPAEAAPLGRLPDDVRPIHYALDLTVVPDQERLSGSVRITVTLARARSVLWLHGQGLHVTEAYVERERAAPVGAHFEQANDDGVAALRLSQPVGPGTATIRLSWDAPFVPRFAGVMRVEVEGNWYAFTQFEDIWARGAFPCFDEPGIKTPWDVTLTVRQADAAIGNTPITAEQSLAGALKRVRFATTEPLPTYLLAWAVGPLDIVETAPLAPSAVRDRPVPLRGVAVRGRGGNLAQALAEVGRTLQALETYFAIAYPYSKLDVIAVPGAGGLAMENAGAVTFDEPLLLLDPASVTEEQRRNMSWVMAHEFAHQWLGDLVTTAWWDDIWLNEAFASWMEARVEEDLHPEYRRTLSLLESVHAAMWVDGLVSARQIRQPIRTRDDITAAFDQITYDKGAGMLAMFERWLGPDTFQRGIRQYLATHRFGSATSTDLLAALSQASGRDVATPMSTFLDQSGVPLVEARPECVAGAGAVTLRQSRYLPVGSTGDTARIWQIPVCVRYQTGKKLQVSCTLLTQAEGRLPLEGEACPTWVMPNADGAGYYRWSLPSAEAARLLTPAAWSRLSARERLSVAGTLSTDFSAAKVPAADVLDRFAAIASDSERRVATAPMGLLSLVRDQVAQPASRPKAEAFARKLYAPVLRRIGLEPRAGRVEDGDTRLLRKTLVEFLALRARDPEVRRDMARKGRAYAPIGAPLHPEAVSPDLTDTALAVAVQDGDVAFFDALRGRLSSVQDAVVRRRIVAALGYANTPALSRRALDLALDPVVRPDEATTTLWIQMDQLETRAAGWQWLKENFAALAGRLGGFELTWLPWLAGGLCDAAHAREARELMGPRVASMPGAAAQLAQALEAIALCESKVRAQRESTESFLARP